ncbi:hypothetical protein ACMXYN_10280 [Neptuniibacter sp. PT8_73]|uniref:hypothetical protein n=1 Tax=Neptuniibacter sp. PT8_73 TaxID=3398206 RepID=UPI0039F51A66
MKRLTTLLLLLIFSPINQAHSAGIYKCKTDQGKTGYFSSPCKYNVPNSTQTVIKSTNNQLIDVTNIPQQQGEYIDTQLVLDFFDKTLTACLGRNKKVFFNLFSDRAKSARYGMLTYNKEKLDKYMNLICTQLDDFHHNQFNSAPEQFKYGLKEFPRSKYGNNMDTHLCIHKNNQCEKSLRAVIERGELRINEH